MPQTCHLFSTEPMTCPLCGVVVPPSTEHFCQKPDPWRNTPPPPGSKEAAEAAKRLKVEQQARKQAPKKRRG
jgi:hypothetical protein